MLLRRITEHVKSQNWFAVAIDFAIVVVGVFIGIQVANWNDQRVERQTERAILAQLDTEFRQHEDELTELAGRLTSYRKAALELIMAIKSDSPPKNPEQMKTWLFDAFNLGRPPARSATYIQLLSSGEFSILSNHKLKTLLVQFDQEIERNRFTYQETLGLLLRSDDAFEAISFDYAAYVNDPRALAPVDDYDFGRLKRSKGKIKWIDAMHRNNLVASERLLSLAEEILVVLEER